jgi:large subunit ribosomal protein L10
VDREQKVAAVERLNKAFQANPHLILANFSELTVNQANVLRRKIGEAGGTYSVIKNRLAKRAAVGTPAEPLIEKLAGPCAVATHAEDPVALAKALHEFAKDNPQIEVLAGLVDGKVLVDAPALKQLAALPGLPELRAQLLALIQTPASQLVRLLNTPGSQLARVIDARRESQGGSGEVTETTDD